MNLICPNCKTKYEKGKFCLDCGTPLIEVAIERILFCPKCQLEFKKGRFCPECGIKLQKREINGTIGSLGPDTDAILLKYRNEYGDLRYLNNEEWAVAFEELQLCASRKNPEAMCFLALLYLHGRGVAQDKEMSYKLLYEAEKEGSKLASAYLGFFYFQGLFVDQNIDETLCRFSEGYKATKMPEMAGVLAMINEDLGEYEKAYEYAQNAAEKGAKTGCKVLGDLYLNGRAVAQDDHKALDYYMQAAALGDEDACNQIGRIYMEGRGVDENPEQAFFWYNESAQKNSDVGMFNVARCYHDGYGVEQNIEKAVEWFKKSAEAKCVDAMLELSMYYRKTLADDGKSKRWLKKAADLGSPAAINHLGVIAEREGKFKVAVKCFKNAIDVDFPDAYLNLALCYREGKGVKKDLKKAEELLAKAAELGIEDASEIHEEVIASKDEEQLNKAITLMDEGKQKSGCAIFRELAKQGNPRAQRNYGRCLLNGMGVKQNLEEGVSWLNKAAEHNDCNAYLILAEAYLGYEYNGKKLKKDFRKTNAYLKKAYELGANPEEVLALGRMTIPSVEISDLKIVEDLKSDGKLGADMVFQMNALGMQGRKLNVMVYCVDEYSDKKCLRDPVKSKNDSLECVFFGTFKASYPSTIWESTRVFIPYPSILNTQKTVRGTLVLMAWDQTNKRPNLLACKEVPYMISCKTHIFSSNEWDFKILNQDQHTHLVKLPKQKEYVLPEKTEVIEPTKEN